MILSKYLFLHKWVIIGGMGIGGIGGKGRMGILIKFNFQDLFMTFIVIALDRNTMIGEIIKMPMDISDRTIIKK